MRIKWGQHVPADALSQLVDFISLFADRYHHGKEEALLFPALERKGIKHEGGPLGVIEHQHEVERTLTAEMRTAIHGYRDIDPESRDNFVDAARRYTDHLIGHIEKEEGILFRIADEMLGDEDKQSLAEAFTRAESEFGLSAVEEYEQIATDMERSWAV
jgi:hemerythrin-like domain-containing protein